MGSGKSTVARIFNILGIPIYHADFEAKKFLSDEIVISQLTEKLGREILINEKIDKRKLAELVFNNQEALQFLNSIIHPLVFLDFKKWLVQHQSSIYIIHEAAVIFENNLENHFDKIITVSAPVELLIQRISKRDMLEKSQIIARLSKQMNQERKVELSDFNIINDEKKSLVKQVLHIHQEIIH